MVGDDPIMGMLAINELRRLIVLHEEQLLRRGLRHHSWHTLANCLGITRQTLHERWAAIIETRPATPIPVAPNRVPDGLYRVGRGGNWIRIL